MTNDMRDLHHIHRRNHAIRRLAERYNLFISVAEYETLAQKVQHEPQYHGTNIVKTVIQGREVYCTIRRDEISTFITPGQANWSIDMGKRNLAPPQSKPMGTLGDLISI